MKGVFAHVSGSLYASVCDPRQVNHFATLNNILLGFLPKQSRKYPIIRKNVVVLSIFIPLLSFSLSLACTRTV